MLKKIILIPLALVLLAAVAYGAGAVLAQDVDEDPVPAVPGPGIYGPGHMWQQQDGEHPFGPGHMWGWDDDRAPADMPGFGRMGGWMMSGNTLPEIAASVLGLTVEEVYAELAEGISLAQLAEDNGSNAQAIVDAFIGAHADALQEAVESGQLTQEQADWMQENMAATIEARVTDPASGFGAGRGYGPGGCHGLNNQGAPGSGPAFGRRGMRGGWGSEWQAPAAPQGPNA